MSDDKEVRTRYRFRQSLVLIGYLLHWLFPIVIMSYRGLTGYGDYEVTALVYPLGFFLINGDPTGWDAFPAVMIGSYTLIIFIIDIIWILIKLHQLSDARRLIDLYGLVGCHLLFSSGACLLGLFAWRGITLEAYASIIISIFALRFRGERARDVWIDPLGGKY